MARANRRAEMVTITYALRFTLYTLPSTYAASLRANTWMDGWMDGPVLREHAGAFLRGTAAGSLKLCTYTN